MQYLVYLRVFNFLFNKLNIFFNILVFLKIIWILFLLILLKNKIKVKIKLNILLKIK